MNDPSNMVDDVAKEVVAGLVDHVVKEHTFVPINATQHTTPEWNAHMEKWEVEQTAWEDAQYQAEQVRIRASAMSGLCNLEDLLEEYKPIHDILRSNLKYDVHLDRRYVDNSVQPFVRMVFEMWIDFYGVRNQANVGRCSLNVHFDRLDKQLGVAIELLLDDHRERIEYVWRGFWVIVNVCLALESRNVPQFESPMAYKKNLHPFTMGEKYQIYEKMCGTGCIGTFIPYFKLGWAKGLRAGFLEKYQFEMCLKYKYVSAQLGKKVHVCPLDSFPNCHFRGTFKNGRCSAFVRAVSEKWDVRSKTASGKRNKGRTICMVNAMYEMLVGPIPGNRKLVQDYSCCKGKNGKCCINPGCWILVTRKGAKRSRDE